LTELMAKTACFAAMCLIGLLMGLLLKLGIDIGQTSVAKYIAQRRGPPSQGWRTFLRNHADGIAAMDLFVVPTISLRLLYGLLILRHDRRRLPNRWSHSRLPSPGWIASPICADLNCDRHTEPALVKPSSPALAAEYALPHAAHLEGAICIIRRAGRSSAPCEDTHPKTM
jgi:hypothetical protein